MKKRITRIFAWLFILLFLVFLLFNSSPGITTEDEKYLMTFLKEWEIELDRDQIHQSQDKEIAYLSRVQDSVMYSIRHFTIPFDSAGNVQCYYSTRKGLCFDRALLLEKFYTHAGFDVRHLYIYFNGRGEYPDRLDFFDKGLLSHAMFEVKTKNGWMAVGTNCNWLGQDQEGQPMTINVIREKLKDGTLQMKKQYSYGLPFYNSLPQQDAFRYVYGIYSRHGQFLKSKPLETLMNSMGLKCRFPDYNISMLFSNL